MPIKKRSVASIPKPKVRFSDAFRPPGRPIIELIREYDGKATEAGWNGKPQEQLEYQRIADEYRERHMNGELYEVDH